MTQQRTELKDVLHFYLGSSCIMHPHKGVTEEYHSTVQWHRFYGLVNCPTNPNLIIDFENKMNAIKSTAPEIVNPEAIEGIRPCVIDHVIDHYRSTITNVRLQDGLIFDLPTNLELKEDVHPEFNKDNNIVGDRKVFRIVKTKADLLKQIMDTDAEHGMYETKPEPLKVMTVNKTGYEIIAEFMGLEWNTYEQLKRQYDSNWNELMPACKKFDTLFDGNVSFPDSYSLQCDMLDEAVTLYDIKIAYGKLLECIEWYNKQLKG